MQDKNQEKILPLMIAAPLFIFGSGACGLLEAESEEDGERDDESGEGETEGTQDGSDDAQSAGESSTGAPGEGEGEGMAPVSVELDFDCIKIDRAQQPAVVPPAGIQVKFRVLDCEGNPVPPLTSADFKIINNEKGEAFGAGLEGGGISELGVPTDYGLFSVVALDMSDSIFNSGAVDDVIDGALEYLEQVEQGPGANVQHEVALVAFGRPQAFDVVQPFTADFALLRRVLEEMRGGESRGSTDLYGAYMRAIELVAEPGADIELDERFVILLTDGTHEAGDEKNMRERAMEARKGTSANLYSIGIDGNYDPTKLAELASTDENFMQVNSTGSWPRPSGESRTEWMRSRRAIMWLESVPRSP